MKEEPKKELLSSLHDFQKKVSPSIIHSIQQHINSDDFNMKKDSLDFLDVKNGVVLSYLIDLTNLTRLQLRGYGKEDETSKACLNRLNEMKALLEKTRPMEKKMRYQLDKLLSLSSTSSAFASSNDASVNNDNDPLSFRPNPGKMVSKSQDDVQTDSDASDNSIANESDDDELKAAKAVLSKGKKKSNNAIVDDGDNTDGIYKAPRLASVPFFAEEKEEQRKARMLKKQKERMKKSEFLQTMQSQFGDKPEEDDMDGGATIGKQREAARRLTERDAEKTRYEEEAFVRLATSRKDKKARNKIMREEASNLNAIADISNIATGVSMAFDDDNDDEFHSITKNTSNEFSDMKRFSNGKRRKENPYIDNDNGDNNMRRKKSNARGGKNSFQRTLYGQSSGNKKKKSKK